MCMEAYKQALANLHDFMILPDNRTITSDTNIEQNRYAIVDIDNDGKEELIFHILIHLLRQWQCTYMDMTKMQSQYIWK